MVLRGNDGILHSCFLAHPGPIPGIVEVGIEDFEIFPVFLRGDLFPVLNPLVAGRQGIKSPVDEHSETGIGPPFHPFGFLWFRFIPDFRLGSHVHAAGNQQ